MRQELYCGTGLGRVAAVLCQMGQVLQKYQETRQGRSLQSVFHLPELRPPHPVNDLHHELDRAVAEGFPTGHEDAGPCPTRNRSFCLWVRQQWTRSPT